MPDDDALIMDSTLDKCLDSTQLPRCAFLAGRAILSR